MDVYHLGLAVVLPRETDSVLIGSAILGAFAAGDFKHFKVFHRLFLVYNNFLYVKCGKCKRVSSVSHYIISHYIVSVSHAALQLQFSCVVM